MDRWEDVDDGITPVQRGKGMGRVARMGIAGFVQAAVSASEQSTYDPPQPGIVVVDSKREQRAAAARQAMPPPPAIAARPAAAAVVAAEEGLAAGTAATAVPVLPRPAVPAGSVPPPAGTVLLVHKAGTLVQHVPITEVMTMFGRLPCNDIILDHASTSRQHAALTFRRQQQQQLQSGHQQVQSGIAAVLCDLGSAHGTLIQGRRATRGQLYPLAIGDVFQFGASTRSYSVQIPAASDMSCDTAVSKKRARVTFAGGGAVNSDPDTVATANDGGSDSRRKLEQGIGQSDSKRPTLHVGPQAVAGGSSEHGRFAHLLESKVVVVKPRSVPRLTQQQLSNAGVPEQQQQQQEAAEKGAITAVATASTAATHGATADVLMMRQKQQQGDDDRQQNAGSTPADDAGNASSAQQRQQQSTSPVPAAALGGFMRSWSGGQTRTLLPPQLARRNSSQQQEKVSSNGSSSLYDQLPKAAAASRKDVQQSPE